MTDQVDRGVLLSALCPKYLHSNSTSHTWPFGAIAELIDNACDPDVRAKHFWIDKTVVKGQDCLSFMDDGNGLDHETMHKMLSFGYSDKIAFNGQEPIGIYGNGFKSGSMRLGKDAIVFSKSENGSCVGMLSQTYLEKIEAKQIMVPIVGFQQVSTNKLSVKEEHKASLRDILCYSPFNTQEELLVETNAINSSSTGRTGTRIIIWNLRRTSTGTTEFDFEKDRYDIRIPSDIYEAMNKSSKQPGVLSYIPESVYSLRAYCSILYLKPRMQIIIRGQMAKSQLIAKSLAYTRKDHYKPNFLNKRIPITFGYNTKSKDQYGVMMYHKNRLIKAYERVGCQLKANNRGVGVIGVMECNFLDPTHSKQSFLESDKYRKTMTSLGIKLEEYWQEIRHKRNIEDPNSLPVEDTMKRADQNWTQCDICRKWRKLPDGIDCSKLPDKWYCRMNPDPQFRSCHVEEEPEDSDDEQPSYRKTYKQQERQEKRNKEKRQKDEEDQRRRQEHRMVELSRINDSLKQHLPQKPAHSPSTPTTPRSSSNTESAARAESLTISPAACSPSSNSGLPVISSVCSLSEAPPRGKRTHPEIPQGTPKRPKLNGSHLSNQNSSTPVNMSPPSVTVELDDDDDENSDDDEIYILETASTPKPNVNLTKMKMEQSDVGKELQCSDAAAVGATLKMNVTGARSAAEGIGRPVTPCPEVSSTTTQTEVHKVKQEKEDQNQTEVEKAGQSCKKSSDVAIKISSEHRVIKEESSSQNHAGPSSQDANNKYSQLNHPRVIKTQNQLEDFVRVMQATLQEGVPLKKNEILTLNLQLKDVQSRLQGLSEITVKQEYSHQATQTEEAEEYKDYKTLFEKAKQKVDELIRVKESLMASSETKPGASSRGDMDELALQVDSLLRELDQRNKERDELQTKLNNIEEERANLASQCEDLRLRLQQQRENKQGGKTSPHRATASSVNTESEEAGGPAASSKSLIGLRHNVGRLLIRSIPALDLGQVNFECNVIDEILEQFLSNQLKDLDTNT